jgi:hypothetical protein
VSASQKANIRRAWLAQRIGQGKSDAENIALCAATFKVSEKTARQDLSAVYDRWIEIDREMAPKHKAAFMELGFSILKEARDAANDPASGSTFAPVVAQFKNLAIMSGVMRDGLASKTDTPAGGDSRPNDQTVRERISALKENQAVREKAMKLGLDLDD